ncbi:tRNA A-37 threonylcarbamoyl transferase component Bud32 [Nocardioides thalensis]|uniref:tRNA A-37 threonylcarbamoyl transferase component Bud32 n=1 Tax=Nocardioides thalensis TaxID=1914755 RepID=A0A853BZ67_9ACTN|nr:DUF4032 domain-containing protein [Nocardioides thalensis]NYJ00056.1 tRNA A-37 threonylcarbamoyl transferase component Bud32 [Nocardioides thalensis]
MALHVVASRPDPALLTLPWSSSLAEWPEPPVVRLPRGLSRHVVRIIQVERQTLVAKETEEAIAFREYRMLRELRQRGLPTVTAKGVVTGRTDIDGDELPATLLTEHLHFSLPYRSLFQQGLGAERLPNLIDAMVVLLVRLHLAGFYWGDVSLSNVLFRRDAGGFAAYLVDAETGELTPTLSDRMREHDITIARENVFAELMDLQASAELDAEVPGHEIIDMLEERYRALWADLTAVEEFESGEMWRIEKRIERLNDLGFDVDELDIVTEGSATGGEGGRVRIQPKVVEAGHHRRELSALTGLDVEDAQARRLLNDIAAFTAHHGLGDLDRTVVANRWLLEVYEPLTAMVPPEARAKLEPAEFFHEVLVHRWYLSEQAGHEVDIFKSAADYIERILPTRPDDSRAGH